MKITERCADRLVVEMNSYDGLSSASFGLLKREASRANKVFDCQTVSIGDVYDDFSDMADIGAGDHIAKYYRLYRDISFGRTVRLFGCDFALSNTAYVLGMGKYRPEQIRADISYDRLDPSRFCFAVDERETDKLIDTLKSLEGEKEPVTVEFILVGHERFRLLTSNSPDYSKLPFPEIKTETVKSLTDGKSPFGFCDEAFEYADRLLEAVRPSSFSELETVCCLLTAGKKTAETVLRCKAEGRKYWSAYANVERFERLLFGFDPEPNMSRRLFFRLRAGKLTDDDIKELEELGVDGAILKDLPDIGYVPRRVYAADLALILWRRQHELNAMKELSDFWPLSDDPDSFDREQDILDRIPCSEEGAEAIKDYLITYESFQAYERLKEINDDLGFGEED